MGGEEGVGVRGLAGAAGIAGCEEVTGADGAIGAAGAIDADGTEPGGDCDDAGLGDGGAAFCVVAEGVNRCRTWSQPAIITTIESQRPKTTLRKMGLCVVVIESGSAQWSIFARCPEPSWPRTAVCRLGRCAFPYWAN